MEYCTIFSALNMAGPRNTLISPPILSGLTTGMRRSGVRGINATRFTGKISSGSIPIGPDTNPASVMTRIFIIATIMARGKVGIEASMAFVLPKMLVMAVRPAKAFGLRGINGNKSPC